MHRSPIRFLSIQSLALATLIALAGFIGGCANRTPVPDQPQDVKPLKAGAKAPVASLRTLDGERLSLKRAYAAQPTVLIFYRGGWCPYCTNHLGLIADAEKHLTDMGFRIFAISPDRPEKINETLEEHQFAYTLLSDSDMIMSRAFGLAFRVDDQTHSQLMGYGIDLSDAAGRNHRMLPVPAVYLVDQQGVIRFAYWDVDYTERLDTTTLVEAARQVIAAELP